jgi:hypothetical protein
VKVRIRFDSTQKLAEDQASGYITVRPASPQWLRLGDGVSVRVPLGVMFRAEATVLDKRMLDAVCTEWGYREKTIGTYWKVTFEREP